MATNPNFKKYDDMFSVNYQDSYGNVHKLYEDGTEEIISNKIPMDLRPGFNISGHKFVSGPGFELMEQEEIYYYKQNYGKFWQEQKASNDMQYISIWNRLTATHYDSLPNPYTSISAAYEKIKNYKKVNNEYPNQKLLELRKSGKLTPAELLTICLKKRGIDASHGQIEPLIIENRYPTKKWATSNDNKNLLKIALEEINIPKNASLDEIIKILNSLDNDKISKLLKSEKFKAALEEARKVENSINKIKKNPDNSISKNPEPKTLYMINEDSEIYKEMKKISQDLEIEKQNRYLKKNGIDLQIGDKFTFKKNGKTVTYKLKGLKFDYDSDKVYIKATKKDPILGIDIECTFKLETLKEITKNNKNSVESLFKKFSSMLKKIEL